MVPAIAAKYGDMASAAAADWYELMRAKWFEPGYETEAAPPFDDKAMRQTIRRLAGHLWDKDGTPADPETMLRGLRANMDRWVKQPARDTIVRNARRDPGKPRYARVPAGRTTCAFCAMLASRGFVYASAEKAGGNMSKYHPDCDCEIIPSWDKKNPRIEGYDPDKLYDAYLKARDSLGKENPTLEEILEAMRRMGGYTDSTDTGFSPKLDKLYKTGNPLQHLAQLTARAVNPRIGTTPRGVYDPYANNCQRCCQIAELRLRGYDVTAAPKGKDDYTSYNHIYISNWQTRDGKQRRWTNGAPRRNATSILEELNTYPVGARFFVAGQWQKKWGGGGHVWNAEIVMENGKKTVKMYDLQGENRDPDNYLSRVKRGGSAYMRIDDMMPSDALVPGHGMNFSIEMPMPNPWIIGPEDHAPTVDEANANRWDITGQQLNDSWREYLAWDYSDPSVPAVAPNGKEITPQK